MSVSNAPRVVVDTNLFLSGAINPHGRPHQVLRAWYEGRIELLLSDWQHAELVNVLDRPRITRQFRLSPLDIAELRARIDIAPRVASEFNISVPLRDAKDEPILAAALGGHADFLVTGDQDPLVRQGDPQLGTLKIVTAVQFLDELADSAVD